MEEVSILIQYIIYIACRIADCTYLVQTSSYLLLIEFAMKSPSKILAFLGMKSLVGKFSRSADSQTATNVINGTRVLECYSPICAQVMEMQKISRRNHSPSGPQNLLLE